MPSRRENPPGSVFLSVSLLILALPLCSPPLLAPARAADRPVLYLANADTDTLGFSVPTAHTVLTEPNLVVVTHGWYERQPWPGWTAQAIAQRVDRRTWCCAWYDWRPQARRLRPSQAANIARDTTGPQLARQIVRLAPNLRHVHLIGHSAGTWLVNAAAQIIAQDTQADIHLTFLDAYVPDGWNEQALGRLACQPPARCWVEHYFTRDSLNLTENVLPQAHNVDITALNPGFPGHKFPWHWYHATVAGSYTTDERFTTEPVFCQANGLTYGFTRARQSGTHPWQQTLTLKPNTKPIRIYRPADNP